MHKRYSAALQVAHRSETQAIQLAKAVSKTLPYLLQARRRDLGIGHLPSRYPFKHAREFAARRIACEPSALRISCFAINSNGSQTGAIQDSSLSQILHIDR